MNEYDAEEVYNLVKDSIKRGESKSVAISYIEAYADRRVFEAKDKDE